MWSMECSHLLSSPSQAAWAKKDLQTPGRHALTQTKETLYSVVMGWLRCCLNFALLHSAGLCIRGTQSSFNHPESDSDFCGGPDRGSVQSSLPQLQTGMCCLIHLLFLYVQPVTKSIRTSADELEEER